MWVVRRVLKNERRSGSLFSTCLSVEGSLENKDLFFGGLLGSARSGDQVVVVQASIKT